MSRSPRLLARRALVVLLAGPLVACGSGAPEPRAAAPHVAYRPLRDPALAEVRTALEGGHPELALRLLERGSGFEAECLRARAELGRGDAVAALATLERARRLDPDHSELRGTEVEVLCALDRLATAEELLLEALRRRGPDPVLWRAQGVLELRRQGHGPAALQAFERARAGDPELPFLAWPMAQAHLLTGRARLEAAPAEATVHARAGQLLWTALDGLHDDLRELEAEGLTGELRFEEAIAIYVELEQRGRTFGETPAILHQRCGTRCLLQRQRDQAVEHYALARQLGLSDEGLGFGREVLEEERAAALERARAAADGGDWAAAEAGFGRALELAPGDLEAENGIAVARFQREDYRGAAESWERVLARARGSDAELPDPVPLNLAKAWRLAGEPERARAVLGALLDREPDGPWSEGARELLLALEAEALAGG